MKLVSFFVHGFILHSLINEVRDQSRFLLQERFLREAELYDELMFR